MPKEETIKIDGKVGRWVVLGHVLRHILDGEVGAEIEGVRHGATSNPIQESNIQTTNAERIGESSPAGNRIGRATHQLAIPTAWRVAPCSASNAGQTDFRSRTTTAPSTSARLLHRVDTSRAVLSIPTGALPKAHPDAWHRPPSTRHDARTIARLETD